MVRTKQSTRFRPFTPSLPSLLDLDGVAGGCGEGGGEGSDELVAVGLAGVELFMLSTAVLFGWAVELCEEGDGERGRRGKGGEVAPTEGHQHPKTKAEAGDWHRVDSASL